MLKGKEEFVLKLTPKELECLDLLSYGLCEKEIASAMEITLSTIKKHKKQVFRKLNVNNSVSAVRQAFVRGILDVNKWLGPDAKQSVQPQTPPKIEEKVVKVVEEKIETEHKSRFDPSSLGLAI